MAQNREPPAYLEYAAAMMARTDYRVMRLAERGLLYALRLECWVNRQVPADPKILARVLGFDVNEIAAALPSVMCFFCVVDGQIYCPELENYRTSLDEKRERQSQGGKQTAAKHRAKRDQNGNGDHAANLPANLQPTCSSLIQSNSIQSNPNTAMKGEPISDEWLSEYERASRGY